MFFPLYLIVYQLIDAADATQDYSVGGAIFWILQYLDVAQQSSLNPG